MHIIKSKANTTECCCTFSTEQIIYVLTQTLRRVLSTAQKITAAQPKLARSVNAAIKSKPDWMSVTTE